MHLVRSDTTLINNVIADNQTGILGSGLFVFSSSSRLLHNTIVRNSGGDGSGVCAPEKWYIPWYGVDDGPSSVALTNTILISHSVGISVTGGSTVTVDAILWHDTPITVFQSITSVVTVQNQYTGDSAFAADGYHLTVGSAAIDQGVDAGVTVDIDGEQRPVDGGYDLGADEFPRERRRVFLPLVLRGAGQ